MPKRKIPENIVEEAASLRRKGHSFRAIGAALVIDPRTAKGLVDRVAAGKNKDHWANVDLQLDAQYLGEHFHLLQQAAAGVLRAVQTHPKITAPTLESGQLLAFEVGSALAQGGTAVLIERGIARMYIADEDIDVPLQVSQSLLRGLKEHEKGLTEALDERGGWSKGWRDFQKYRCKLIDQARRLFLQRGYEESASSMAETAVKALMQQGGEYTKSAWVVGEPPSPDAPEVADYGWVIEQISLRRFRERLNELSESVDEAANQVANAVVEFQLRGKPEGRCFLCPSRSGP